METQATTVHGTGAYGPTCVRMRSAVRTDLRLLAVLKVSGTSRPTGVWQESNVFVLAGESELPNFRRMLAGATARILGCFFDGMHEGDITWLARTLYRDRDTGAARSMATYANAYYDIFYRNCSGDITANGETELLARLGGLPVNVAVDVGANVGDWTLAMKRAAPGATIHAFEIVPQTADVMASRIGRLPDVYLNRFGLSDAPGELNIWYSPDHSNLASAIADRKEEFASLAGTWQAVRAQVKTGDDYIDEAGISHVDFLKIDVEGSEMRVLRGLERSFARNAIDVVQFEYAPMNKFIPLLLREFHAFFEPRGFRVGKVFPKGVAFKDYEPADEDFKGLTYIACRTDRPDIMDRIAYRI